MEQQIIVTQKDVLRHQLKNSAHWFYWIAGLSILNSFVVYMGSTFVLVLGLGATQIVDYAVLNLQGIGRIMALVINILIATLFVFFGYKASQGKRWAFIAGLVVYAIDSLIFVFAKDVIGIVFHVFVLWSIWRGLITLKSLSIEELGTAQSNPEAVAGLQKKSYQDLPDRQKADFNTRLIAFGLVIPPLLWWGLYNITKYDVYDNNYDEQGNLKKWRSNSHIAAWILLGFQLFLIGGIVMSAL